MRVLSVVGKQYYGQPGAIEPMFLEFTDPLMDLGHSVEHYDHILMHKKHGPRICGELFVESVRKGKYDVVFYQTACQSADEIGEYVREAGRYSPIVAWNSDDDWTWDIQTKHMAPFFTFMFTTYPNIFEANRVQFPNLRLSQWGCYDRFARFDARKDLDFTFAGKIYGERVKSCRYLKNQAGLQVFGQFSGMLDTPDFLYWPVIRKVTFRFPSVYGRAITFEEVNTIWNRSKISFTPMEASVDPNILQIKSRTFEMGLSGTLMLCQHSPNLEKYYDPGKEFIPFYDLDDCIGKAKYFLAHESERLRIAKAYRDRTKAEHLWQHRFKHILHSIGI